jgi:hypothetical protein
MLIGAEAVSWGQMLLPSIRQLPWSSQAFPTEAIARPKTRELPKVFQSYRRLLSQLPWHAVIVRTGGSNMGCRENCNETYGKKRERSVARKPFKSKYSGTPQS